MNNRLKYWLSLLWQNARKELSEKPIESIGILVGIFVVVLPLLLSESLRGFVVYLLSALLQPIIALSIFPLAIAVLALVVTFILSPKKIDSKEIHYFIPYQDFTWKINLSSDGYPEVDNALL